MEARMTWWERVRTFEPALLRAILAALAVVLGTVGLDLSDAFGRIDIAWTAIFALIPLIQGWWTRSAVVPQNAVVEVVDPAGRLLAGPASPLPTGTVISDVDEVHGLE